MSYVAVVTSYLRHLLAQRGQVVSAADATFFSPLERSGWQRILRVRQHQLPPSSQRIQN